MAVSILLSLTLSSIREIMRPAVARSASACSEVISPRAYSPLSTGVSLSSQLSLSYIKSILILSHPPEYRSLPTAGRRCVPGHLHAESKHLLPGIGRHTRKVQRHGGLTHGCSSCQNVLHAGLPSAGDGIQSSDARADTLVRPVAMRRSSSSSEVQLLRRGFCCAT